MRVSTFPGNAKRVLLSIVSCAALLLMGGAPVTGSATWRVGDLVVCVGSGVCRIYSSPTTFTTISVLGSPKKDTGEPAWSSAFALYVVDARNQKVHLFSKTDPHEELRNIDTSDASPDGLPGPLVVDSAGNLYVGMTNLGVILKYNRAGDLPQEISVSTELGGGVDWMALADDHKTLYFTSSGHSLQRVDLTAATPVTTGLTLSTDGTAAGLRILPVPRSVDPDDEPIVDGSNGILVADGVDIKWVVDGVVQTKKYDVSNTVDEEWRAVTLHPDGETFLAATGDGRVYTFEIDGSGAHTGAPINTESPNVSGLSVKGGPQLNILPVNFTAGTTAVADAVELAVFGNPQAGPTDAFPRHAFGILIPSLPAGSDALVVVSANWAEGDGVCPMGETVATDYDCRADANFVDVPRPRCIPYVSSSRTDCVFYRLEDNELTVPPSSLDSLVKFIDFHNPANGYSPDPCTGNTTKGNPRMLFVEEHGAAFTDDITLGTTQTAGDPIFGGGTGRTKSDYGAFDRCLGEGGGATAQFIKPVALSVNKSRSSLPFEVKVTRNGQNVLNAVTAPNNMSLLVRNNGTGATFLEPQPVPGGQRDFFKLSGSSYKANWDTTGKAKGSYTACVTSIAQPDGLGEFQDVAGLFAPVCRTFSLK